MSTSEYSVKNKKKKGLTLIRTSKFITKFNRPWDDRFHIMTTKNNQNLHVYYKELFGKPSRMKQEEVLLHDKGRKTDFYSSMPSPFISTTTTKHRSTFKNSRRSASMETLSRKTLKENKWVHNFAIMGSKNNDRVHRHYQEYFDRPVKYDNQGYKRGIKKSGFIYDKLSPVRQAHLKEMRQSMKSKSVASLKRKSSCENEQRENDSNNGFNDRINENGGENPKKESNGEIGNSQTIQDAIVHQRQRKGKRRNLRGSMERDIYNGRPMTRI